MPVDPDIRRSETLSTEFYFSDSAWDAARENIFCRTWQLVGDEQEFFKGADNVHPFRMLENYLEEPLLLVKGGQGSVSCLSNVCTHRGFPIVQQPARVKKLVCGYHGRRFNLQGKFEFMPEFREAECFPRACDHLAGIPLMKWRRFLFASLTPEQDFEAVFKKIDERLGFLPIERFRYAPEYDTTYSVRAHWALYCDNYLEGFHIPFVHNTLNAMLDYGSYTTICEPHMVLQIGYSDKKGSETFNLPEGHPDHGRSVTGYYYWVFPNFMLNVYPWGMQVNVVKPVSKDFCKVEFSYYIHDEKAWERMDGLGIAEVTQREDEFVVEGVQRGLSSRFYPNGRFSPARESGVHHFHMLLKEYMGNF